MIVQVFLTVKIWANEIEIHRWIMNYLWFTHVRGSTISSWIYWKTYKFSHCRGLQLWIFVWAIAFVIKVGFCYKYSYGVKNDVWFCLYLELPESREDNLDHDSAVIFKDIPPKGLEFYFSISHLLNWRRRKRYLSTHGVTHQMLTTVKVGPAWSQDSETQSGSPRWMAVIQVHEASSRRKNRAKVQTQTVPGGELSRAPMPPCLVNSWRVFSGSDA